MSPGSSCLGGHGRRVLSGRLGHGRVLVVAALSSSPAALAAGVIISLVVGVAVALLAVGGPVRLGGVTAAGAVAAPVLQPSMLTTREREGRDAHFLG